ncbi:MAG: hypothetical protein IMZ44_18885 [Planctomycetes bacterium]|nr:hypothetical protein [Planctomycetota bacterium]
MIEVHSRLSNALGRLSNCLKGANAAPVQSQALLELAKSFVRLYFGEFRTQFTDGGIPDDALSPLDTEMQELLRHTQKRTLKKKYATTLKAIRKAADQLELEITLRAAATPNEEPGMDEQDIVLLSTLATVCAPAAASYRQGLKDLNEKARLSWRGTATEFREALRETLDVLAPDDAVKSQPGFKPEPNTDGPTMKQKTVFILKSRREGTAAIETAKKGLDLIEEKVGAFLRSVYTRSSASTHGSTSRQEAASIRDHAALLLTELLALPR